MDRQEEQLLIRIDERTKLINSEVNSLKNTISKEYVTHNEFKPVRSIVYGMVAFVLFGILGAVMALVIKSSI